MDCTRLKGPFGIALVVHPWPRRPSKKWTALYGLRGHLGLFGYGWASKPVFDFAKKKEKKSSLGPLTLMKVCMSSLHSKTEKNISSNF